MATSVDYPRPWRWGRQWRGWVGVWKWMPFSGHGTSDLAATSSCSRCKKYEWDIYNLLSISGYLHYHLIRKLVNSIHHSFRWPKDSGVPFWFWKHAWWGRLIVPTYALGWFGHSSLPRCGVNPTYSDHTAHKKRLHRYAHCCWGTRYLSHFLVPSPLENKEHDGDKMHYHRTDLFDFASAIHLRTTWILNFGIPPRLAIPLQEIWHLSRSLAVSYS